MKYNIRTTFFFLLAFLCLFSQHPTLVSADTSTCTGYETSGPCRPELLDTQCLGGTTRPSGAGATCTAVINSQYQTISTCVGTETDGPCRPDRINEFAAQAAAKKAGPGCTAVALGGFGVDTNTGLTHFWETVCPTSSSSGSSGSTGTSAMTNALRDATLQAIYTSTQNIAQRALQLYAQAAALSGVSSSDQGTSSGGVSYGSGGYSSGSSGGSSAGSSSSSSSGTSGSQSSATFAQFGPTSTSSEPVSPNHFRYLRVSSKKYTGVGYSEIEFYGNDGAKITAIKAFSSQQGNPSVPAVIDQNLATSFSFCDNQCSGKFNTGAVVVDLGKVTDVSKIRLLDLWWYTGEQTTFSVSNDNVNYKDIKTFTDGDIGDNPAYIEWLEFPQSTASYTSYNTAPSVSLTVNGKKEITVRSFEGIVLSWNSSIVDSVKFSGTPIMISGINPCIPWPDFPSTSLIQYRLTPFAVMGNIFNGQLAWVVNNCNAGKTLSISYTGRQKSTGKSISDSVIVHVVPANPTGIWPSQAHNDEFTLDVPEQVWFNENTPFLASTTFQSIMQPVPNPNPSLYAQSYSYNFPKFSIGAVPSGLQFTSNGLVDTGMTTPSAIGLIHYLKGDLTFSSSGLPAGFNFVRVYLNQGQPDEEWTDMGIFVAHPDPDPSIPGRPIDNGSIFAPAHTTTVPPAIPSLSLLPAYANVSTGAVAKFKAWYDPVSNTLNDGLTQSQNVGRPLGLQTQGWIDVTAAAVWSSGDQTIAQPLSTAGQFSILSSRTTTVTATYGGITASAIMNSPTASATYYSAVTTVTPPFSAITCFPLTGFHYTGGDSRNCGSLVADGSGTSATATSTQQVLLTVNGQHDLTVNVGDTLTYNWDSQGAVSADSSYVIANGGYDTCLNGNSAHVPWGWVAHTVLGTESANVKTCQAGVDYKITYTVTLASGGTASDSIVVHVRPLSASQASGGAQTVASGTFNRDLYYGMSGPDIIALQKFLISQGDFTDQATGNFLNETFSAVKQFQGEHGIPQTGYFGTLTRQVANAILAGTQ